MLRIISSAGSAHSRSVGFLSAARQSTGLQRGSSTRSILCVGYSNAMQNKLRTALLANDPNTHVKGVETHEQGVEACFSDTDFIISNTQFIGKDGENTPYAGLQLDHSIRGLRYTSLQMEGRTVDDNQSPVIRLMFLSDFMPDYYRRHCMRYGGLSLITIRDGELPSDLKERINEALDMRIQRIVSAPALQHAVYS